MNAFTIAGIVGIGVILVGILLAALMAWLSRMVTDTQVSLSRKQTAYNPALTMGHQIPVEADLEAQLRAARLEAARRAATLERGANMRIGRLGESTLQPASRNLDDDPVTAVKIAAFHTWQGARVGPPVAGAPAAAAPVAGQQRAAVMKRPEDLKPGVDYPYIEITEGMDPAEVRRARIANAKAQAAAVKALKEAGVPAEAGVAAPAAAPGAVAPVAAPAVNVPEPELIEITDDMPPDQVRAARIANAKAQAAYQKALKEAQAAAPAVAQPAAAVPAAAAPAPAATPAVNVPEPELIEITDDMAPDQVRAARIANAKAQAAYQKALKEAGATAPAAQPAAAPAPAPAAAPQPAAPAQAAPSNIPRPDLIEITDDMDPNEVRRARIANAKAKAEYQKALREAGIDPATVPLD